MRLTSEPDAQQSVGITKNVVYRRKWYIIVAAFDFMAMSSVVTLLSVEA